MKRVLIFTFLIIFNISCANKKNNQHLAYSSKKKITKNLFIVDSIKFNYTKNSLIGNIGASTVRWKNYILFTDVVNKQIIAFNNKFKFIKKIGKKGKGPGEYIYSPFFIFSKDYSDDSLYLFSPKLQKINIYNNNLDYIRSKNLDAKFIYELKPALKIKNNFIFSAIYPYSVMKTEYYQKYKSLIVLNNNCKFVKEILKWDKIYYNEKILGFLGTNNSTLLTWGNNNKFYALQQSSFKIHQLNEDFNVVKTFGIKPVFYKSVPKVVDPIKTQNSYKSFVEYKTNVTEFTNISFDELNNNLFVQYVNVTADEIYKEDKFAGEWYLQIYNKSHDVVFDGKIKGVFLFVDKGNIYILEKETPKYFLIKIYKLIDI